MNFIDLIVIIITSFFLLRGLFRGFILELTIVIGLIAGYLIAISYYDYLSIFVFKEYFPQIPDSISNIISFAVMRGSMWLVIKIFSGSALFPIIIRVVRYSGYLFVLIVEAFLVFSYPAVIIEKRKLF